MDAAIAEGKNRFGSCHENVGTKVLKFSLKVVIYTVDVRNPGNVGSLTIHSRLIPSTNR